MRAIAIDRHTAHVPSVALVIIERKMLDTSIVPKSNRACGPAKTAGELLLRAMVEEELEERSAFATGHVFEMHSEGRIDVKRFAPCFWMGAHNRVFMLGDIVTSSVDIH